MSVDAGGLLPGRCGFAGPKSRERLLLVLWIPMVTLGVRISHCARTRGVFTSKSTSLGKVEISTFVKSSDFPNYTLPGSNRSTALANRCYQSYNSQVC